VPFQTGLGQVILATRVQIIVAVMASLAFLSDAMAEALRFALLDEPLQVYWIAGALFLATGALNITARAMIGSSRTPLLQDPGWAGFIVRWWPTLLAAVPAIAILVRTAALQIDDHMSGTTYDLLWPLAIMTMATALSLLVTGLASSKPTARPVWPLRVALSAWLFAIVLYVALLVWRFSSVLYATVLRPRADGGDLWNQLYPDPWALLAGIVFITLFAILANWIVPFVNRCLLLSTQRVSARTALAALSLVALFAVALNEVIVRSSSPDTVWTLVVAASTTLALGILANPILDHVNTLIREGDWLSYRFPLLRPMVIIAVAALGFMALGFMLLSEIWKGVTGGPAPVNELELISGLLLLGLFPLGFLRVVDEGGDPRGEYPGQRTARHTLSLVAQIDRTTQWWLAAVLILTPVLCRPFFDASNVNFFWQLGAVTILLIWCAAAVGVFFTIALFGSARKVWTLTLLFVTSIALSSIPFPLNDNHRLPGSVAEADASTGKSEALSLDDGASALDDRANESGEHFLPIKWFKSRPDLDRYNSYPIFLVATEGGGLRAAYFTGTVLGALQRMCHPSFANHLAAISSVSGGSLGATEFAASVANYNRPFEAHLGPDTLVYTVGYSAAGNGRLLTVGADHAIVWTSHGPATTRGGPQWQRGFDTRKLVLALPQYFQGDASDRGSADGLEPSARGWDYYSGAISPDGTRVVLGTTHGGIQIWDLEKGTLADVAESVRTKQYVTAVGFSEDGTKIVAAAAVPPSGLDSLPTGWSRVYDVSEAQNADKKRIYFPLLWQDSPSSLDGRVFTAAFAKYGQKEVILTGGADGFAHIWSLGGGNTPMRSFPHGGIVMSASISGSLVVTAGQTANRARSEKSGSTNVTLWDTTTGEIQRVGGIGDEQTTVWSAAFQEGGGSVLLASSDGIVRVMRVSDREIVQKQQEQDAGRLGQAFAAVFLDRGRILSAHEKGAIIWPAPTEVHAGGCDLDALLTAESFKVEGRAFPRSAERTFKYDLLAPSLAGLLFADSFQRIVPWPNESWDRSRYVARAFETAWQRGRDCDGCEFEFSPKNSLLALTAAKSGTSVPELILNTTEVETGRPRGLATKKFNLLHGAGPDVGFKLSKTEVTEHDVMLNDSAESLDGVLLSDAAVLSARFPYLLPSARVDMHDQPPRRYVDGGYFESSGTWVLGKILNKFVEAAIAERAGPSESTGPGRERPKLIQSQIHVLLIQSTPHNTGKSCMFGGREQHRGECVQTGQMHELLSPLLALERTRVARAEVSNLDLNDQISLLNERIKSELCKTSDCRQGVPNFIKIHEINFAADNEQVRDDDVPLTWVLSQRARDLLDARLAELIKDVDNNVENEQRTITNTRLEVEDDVSDLPSPRGTPLLGLSTRTREALQLRLGIPLDSIARSKWLALSADGKTAASVSREGEARLWDIGRDGFGSGRQLRGHGASVNTIAFSPGADRVVTASDDGSARIWDVATGKEISPALNHNGFRVQSAQYSLDGHRIVTSGADGSVRAWSATTFQPTSTPAEHGDRPGAASFLDCELITADKKYGRASSNSAMTDDRTMCARGYRDGRVRLFDVEQDAGGEKVALKGVMREQHPSGVIDVEFTKDGKYLRSTSEGGEVRTWRLLSRWDLAPFRHVFCALSQTRQPADRARDEAVEADVARLCRTGSLN